MHETEALDGRRAAEQGTDARLATGAGSSRTAYRVISCDAAPERTAPSDPDPEGVRGLGALLAVARDGALTRLWFCDSADAAEARGRRLPDAVHAPEAEPLPAVAAQLGEYFAGRRRRFDLPLDPQGTPFQRAVWRALVEVPWGETRSYGDLARTVGQPGAARAIGGAMNRNPIAIVVPCHRIVGSDGRLTGYGAGIDRKRVLLALEGTLPQEAPTLPFREPPLPPG